jgi:hypothetical protein
MKKTVAGICIGLLLCPALAGAGVEKAGTTAANFLSLGSGARILGMGGATLGLAGGLDAGAWNTGALGWVERTELTFSHAGLAEDAAQEWIAAGGRLGRSETRWALSGLYQTEGSFEGRDALGGSTGSFEVASMAVGGQLAHRFGRRASVGFGAKWVNEDLGAMRGSGLTFDGGMLVRVGMLGFGVAAQNAGGHMGYGSRTYPFPTSVGGGISLDHAASGLRLDVDVNVPTAYYKNLRGGIEWRWKDRLALRSGYRAELGAPSDEALTGPAFGMGAGAYGLWLDYGYLVTRSGEGQHRMGLSLRPGQHGWSLGDPFGQKKMPREFDDTRIGPPAPASPEPASSGKKKTS